MDGPLRVPAAVSRPAGGRPPARAPRVAIRLELTRDAEGRPRLPLVGVAEDLDRAGAVALLVERLPPGTLATAACSGGGWGTAPAPAAVPVVVTWVAETAERPARYRHGLRFVGLELPAAPPSGPGPDPPPPGPPVADRTARRLALAALALAAAALLLA